MRPTPRPASRRNCNRWPRAATDGKWWWRSCVATERRLCAKHSLSLDEGYRRFELALAHYARGDRPAADAALAEMVAKDRNLLAYQIAEVYAWRRETDKAFEWLQIAF